MVKKKRSKEEQQLQIATAQWLALQYPNINAFHVPNEGKRRGKIIGDKFVCLEGANLKRCGMKAGVSDWIILEPRNKYHGLVIELKSKEGTVPESQELFLNKCTERGYLAGICRSKETFVRVVTEYLNSDLLI